MGFLPCIIITIIGIWLEIFYVGAQYPSFYENYDITWGRDHILFSDQGRLVQLSLDNHSGSGFASKEHYASGYFQMRIKLPRGDSGGVVTAFYLNSPQPAHDELDFEFLGNRPGKPILLQTNVFINGIGNREQRNVLWFDPSADFHYYKLLWNQHQTVFLVDDTPIRIFKNVMNKGVGYPNKAMQVVVSLWDGSGWATDGGLTKINWFNAPFQTQFQRFRIDGCTSAPNAPNVDCYSPRFSWNNIWQLTPVQQGAYENAKRLYMTYDYCTDKTRYPYPPPECT